VSKAALANDDDDAIRNQKKKPSEMQFLFLDKIKIITYAGE